MTTKPVYRVPTMDEIRAIPWNGYNVASTFSGGGGSSTGYRMAGFRVLYANEFIPSARETYSANAALYTHVDGRDIRTVSGADILAACNLKAGELDLLDGSPPCASFSTAGKREAGWGTVKQYSDTAQRTDDLFFEFARLVREIRPKTIVAENVSGLVKGTAKGYFLEILAALKACGYRVEAKLLDAQWLGVPQSRQRLIFVGVRDDIGVEPAFPSPLGYRFSVRDALDGIADPRAVSVRRGTLSVDKPAPTVLTHGRLHTHSELGLVVESDSWMTGYATGREREKTTIGGTSGKYFQLQRAHPDKPSPCITQRGGDASAASVSHPLECRKFSIAELRRICAFPDDYKIAGTYAQQYERCGRAVPPVMMSHIAAAVRDRVLKVAAA